MSPTPNEFYNLLLKKPRLILRLQKIEPNNWINFYWVCDFEIFQWWYQIEGEYYDNLFISKLHEKSTSRIIGYLQTRQ